jgi:cytoskeleton protein RodZ
LKPAQETSPTQAQAHAIPAGEAQSPRIVIRAEHDSWVQIVKDDNGPLMARLLKAGESYGVPNAEGLTMDSGNIGALRLVVDGETLDPLGPLGGIARGVTLDPDKLKSGAFAAR